VRPHAVTSLTNGAGFLYDANGSMTQRVELSGTQRITYTQSWNADNLLSIVTNTVSGAVTAFTYDGDGQRVKQTVQLGAALTTTFYLGAVEIISGTQRVTRTHYSAGGSLIAIRELVTSTNKLYFVSTDHLGSTSLVTCGNAACGGVGSVVARQYYYAYGSVRPGGLGNVPTDYGFTGQRLDDYIKLIQLGSRWYDPVLGRFTSPDPIVPDPYNPQSLNRYTYGYNSPLRYIDPTGNTPWDVVDVIFFLLSAYDFAHNPTWANAGWLLLDTTSLVPIIPSTGYIRRGVQALGLYDEIVQFVARHSDIAVDFSRIAHKHGATTLLRKLMSTSDKVVQGALFELEYGLKNVDEIAEIGRKLPNNSEIDFVTRGNVFVNVKNYDWSDPFFQQEFGMQRAIDDFLRQAGDYVQYGASGVKFVFKGGVPDAVRQALEAAGVIVEVIP
jgi:RHS repeat-associated protein